MPSFLKELSIAIGLLGSEHVPVADADGWTGYVWQTRPAATCKARDERGFCEVAKGSWDWKRPQHFSFSLRTDVKTDTVTARLKLDNQDPADQDHVCVVALFLDDQERQVGVFYQNWVAPPNRTTVRDVPLTPSPSAASVQTVAIGTKQCDAVAKLDIANYQRTRQTIGRN